MPKVFLSHSSLDKPFVEQLYQKLTEDGIDTFFDKESIKAGDSIVEKLREALDEFEVFVCVYSPDYFDSNWGSKEWESVLMSALSGESGKRILPIYLRDSEIPTLLSDYKYIDLRARNLDKAYPEILEALGSNGLGLPPAAPLPTPQRSILPYGSLNGFFIGRHKFIKELHQALKKEPVVAVEGMAGVGKTQIAVEYAYRFAHRYYQGGVIWIAANGGEKALVRSLRQFTGEEGKAFAETPGELKKLWGLLSGPPRQLVVLDNLDHDPEALEKWLPDAFDDIRVLITTRGINSVSIPTFRLECFSSEEGLELLLDQNAEYSPEEIHSAKQLVGMMGGLPLALELVRNFLKMNPSRKITFLEIVGAIRNQGRLNALKTFSEKYKSELPTGCEKDITATFDLIIKQLKAKESLKILQAMSLMAPEPVPEKLLKKILGFPAGNVLEDPFKDLVDDLDTLSLVELLEGTDSSVLYTHPLLDAFVRNKVSAKNPLHKKIRKMVEQEMERTRDPEDEKSYYSLEWVLPHAEKLVEEASDLKWIISMSKHIGYHHKRHGRYIEAETNFQRVMEISTQEFKPKSPEIASAKYHLGQILHELGKFDTSLELLKDSLEIYKELGYLKKYPGYIGRGKSYLAKLYFSQGDFQTALTLQQAALDLNKKKYPLDHPYVNFVQTNLARVHRALGNFTLARDLLKRSLQLNVKRFGSNPHHRFIAKSKLHLANLYQDLGDFRKARRLFREAYESNLVNFGPDHPRTTRCQYNLGNVLIEMEHFEAGIGFLQKALAANQENYSAKNSDHEYIAKVGSDLAVAFADYADQLFREGKAEEAEKHLEEAGNLQEESIKAVLKVFPQSSPQLTPFYINQGKVLLARGFQNRAKKYLGMALQSNLKVYGDKHPYTDRVKELYEDLKEVMQENTDDN